MNRQKREEMRRSSDQNNQASQNQSSRQGAPQSREQVRGSGSDDRSHQTNDAQRREGKLPLPE